MNLAFWRRDWELVDKQEFKSERKQDSPANLEVRGASLEEFTAALDAFRSTIIVVYIFKCKLTGKVKKEVVRV